MFKNKTQKGNSDSRSFHVQNNIIKMKSLHNRKALHCMQISRRYLQKGGLGAKYVNYMAKILSGTLPTMVNMTRERMTAY